MGVRRGLTNMAILLTLTGCATSSNASSVPTTSSTGIAPAPIGQALLSIDDLPGAWSLDDAAPNAADEQTDPSAQELNRCLGIPPTAQPSADRSAFSIYFAQTPKRDDSLIVNASATRIAEPSRATDNIAALRSAKMKTCYEPSVKNNAVKQYQVMGYDVKDATVDVFTLDALQNDPDRYAFRSTISISLNDGRTLQYFIDSFGMASGTLYTTLMAYRADEPPQQDLEIKMLDKLHAKTAAAAAKLQR